MTGVTPLGQDLLHNAPKPPPGRPERLVRSSAVPMLALRLRLIARTVPERLRYVPMTRAARQQTLRGDADGIVAAAWVL